MQCPYLKQNIAKNCLVGFLGGSHSGCWLCGASNNQKIPNAFWDQVCRRNNAQNTMKCNLHPVKHVQLSHICCTPCTATELMVIAVMQQITVIRTFFNIFIKSLSISLKKELRSFYTSGFYFSILLLSSTTRASPVTFLIMMNSVCLCWDSFCVSIFGLNPCLRCSEPICITTRM